ncbi:hypothetical protein MUS1_15300 [Marinomonas ushuaiensis DSM 15871]|uniref:Uncharacterized protein n=1 Tax=Marinomonas ushuaiensis DSM 15871 TaxID=1122207 RepID=X7E533_9GAMM|nr:hypothetical protein [Marinomonas ushuaiensis]ETX10281.1 hypothetical protein MUS1_15300 [Marinomonas ushuaiensis DSM 15871]
MKDLMRKLCSPVLNMFEAGDGQGEYRKSHRTILLVLGGLCFVIALVSLFFTLKTGELAGIIPISLFFITGLVCEIVGLLGSNQAVARIWKRD